MRKSWCRVRDGHPLTCLPHLTPQGRKFVYAGSSSGVVQAPVAFCEKHATCEDCVLARDPYCAWSPAGQACVALHLPDSHSRYRGDAASRLTRQWGRRVRVTVPACVAGT